MAHKRMNAKDHDDRKNPRSREIYTERRKKQNALRAKQVYDEATKTWIRG